MSSPDNIDVQSGVHSGDPASVGDRAPVVERWLLWAIFLAVPVLTLRPVSAFRMATLLDLLLAPLLVIWFTRRLLGSGPVLPPTCFRRELWLLLTAGAVATAFAADPGASAFGIAIFMRFYLLFRITADVLVVKEDARRALALIAMGLVASACLGVAQGSLGASYTLGDPELNQNVSASIGGQRVVRTIGTFANSLNFANYVSVALFTLPLLPLRGTWRRVIVTAAVVIAVIALLQTLSRGPIIAAAVAGIAFFSVGTSGRASRRVAILAVALASTAVVPVFGSRLTQSLLGESLFVRFAAVAERLDMNVRYGLWIESSKVLHKHAVGVGLRNSDYRVRWPQNAKAIEGYFPYSTRSWKPFNFHFENVYLAAYMNLGLLGLLGFVGLVWRALAEPLRRVRGGSDGGGESRVLFAALSCFALNMVTNPAILSDLRVMVLFWLLLGVVAALSHRLTPAATGALASA